MSEFEQEIKERLLTLSDKAKILFGVLTFEKLYPHYVAFENRNSRGSSAILLEAQAVVYQHLINDELITTDEIKEMIKSIDLITPDMDDFGEAISSFALNACTSMLSTLDYILSKNDDSILEVCSYALDTVDMYIQEKEDMSTTDPSREIQIEYDDFMISEKNRQRKLLDKLSIVDLSHISDNLINSLRDDSPIIDLSLLDKL